MSSDIQNYLSTMEDKFKSYQSQQPKNSSINKVKDLNSSVLNQIGNQIIESRIIIPQHQKKLKLKTLPPHNELQFTKMDQKFNQIKQKKKTILDELHQIQLMESSIKMSRSAFKHTTASTHLLKRSKVKSEFTQEDLNEIRQIYKKQKKFRNKIQMGIKKYQEDLENFKKQKEEQQKEKHRQLCLQRHQQREKYILESQERNKKREQMLNQQHQKILQLKKKQKLFQKLESKFLGEKQIQAEEMKQKLNDHKKKREFSFDDMKVHQEKYLERKRVEDQEREQKIRNFKNANELKFPCLFMDKIKDQKERQRHQSQEKKEIIKVHVQKKSAFAEQVRKNLHDKIKTMSESKLTKMNLSTVSASPKWLNTPQKYEQGTKYMREINAKISKLPKKVVETNDDDKKPKFKNYLHDLKAQNQEKRNEAKQTNINNFVSQIGILQAKQNITSQNLAKSIKAKIELMNKLQQMQ